MVNFFQVGSRFSDPKSRSIDPEPDLDPTIGLLFADIMVGIVLS
jgi:hypothetical protein